MKVAIAGFGLEGQSSLEYYRKLGHQVTVLDEDSGIKVPKEVKAVLGDKAFKDLDQYDLIVRSAGIQPSKLICDNQYLASKVTTQLNEFMKLVQPSQVIGVTGTKGKGTTTTLIYKMLQAGHLSSVIGGNIGVPMLSLVDRLKPNSLVVLELSSFQLSDFKGPSPYLSVCLMVEPEHLDWHGNLTEYVLAKSNLFRHSLKTDVTIYNPNSRLSKKVVEASKAKKLAYLRPPNAHILNNQLIIDDQLICQVGDFKLLGKHNWQNICASVTSAWQFTQDIKAIREVVTNFSGLEHRLEFVVEVRGVKYYNDSFASQPKATEAALDSIEGTKILIVGGYDRMLNLSDLAKKIKQSEDQIRHLILIGASAQRLAEALDKVGFFNYLIDSKLTTMSAIVSQASRLAQSGDSVILSPGFASFDMFNNFVDRGKQFKQAVKAL